MISILSAGLLVLSTLAFGQRYSNQAVGLGVVHTMESSDGFGGGATFFDFDNDGWDDITLVNENDSLYFFHNLGGTFERIHLTGVIDGVVRQAIWVDYDNDGDNDLFVSAYEDGVKVFRNEGDLAMVDVTNEAGFTGLFTKNYGFSFADYDHDGDLDTYLARYLQNGNPNDPMAVNALYRNNGDGTFTNVTSEAGVANNSKLSFIGAWMDYNNDGWADLMVINDKLSHNNSLYHNNGDGTFTEVTEDTNSAMPLTDAMSATFADFDNDLDLDFYSTSTYHVTTPPKLLVNQNGEYFTEEADARGLNFNFWSWGAAFFDADNNTNLDFYIATGFTTGHWQPEVQSGYFENDGDHTYTLKSAEELEGSSKAASYGLAIGDANNDGYPEILSLNAENYNSFLWMNAGGENNYIKVTLEGTVSNRMAIGSWIHVFAGGNQYVHYTRCGEGYCSQHSQHHIFGLADATTVDSLKVEYSSGHTDTYYNLPVNEHHNLLEGETYTASIIVSGSLALCEGENVALDAGIHSGYLWNTGDTTSSITVDEPGEYYVETWNAFGINTWSDTVLVEMVPPTEVDMLVADESCAGEGDGAVTIQGMNSGLENITWNTGDTTASIQNLAPGVYSFSAQNESGCAVSGEVSIDGPAPLIGQAQVNDALCYGVASGSASLNLLGGTPPFEADWSVANPDSLEAGAYSVLVSDDNGCEIIVNFTIDQPDSLAFGLITQDASNGDNNGSAELEISGGTPPYAVNWSSGESDLLFIDDLAPGDYTVIITDDNGCTKTVAFTINTNTSLAENASGTPLLFPNPNDGQFRLANCPAALFDLVVLDELGRTVANLPRQRCGEVFALNELSAGSYILVIRAEEQQYHLRLLISGK